MLSQKSGIDYKSLWEFFLKIDAQVCTSDILPENLLTAISEHYDVSFDIPNFIEFWMSSFRKIQKTYDIMVQLHSEGYDIGIITNIYPGVLRELQERDIIPNQKKISYSVIIDSSDLGVAKPDVQVFKIATILAAEKGYKPDQVLFIDDSAVNVIVVGDCGFRTLRFDPEHHDQSVERIKQAVESYGRNKGEGFLRFL